MEEKIKVNKSTHREIKVECGCLNAILCKHLGIDIADGIVDWQMSTSKGVVAVVTCITREVLSEEERFIDRRAQ